jgi:alcohol dehydrogenase class IV
MNFDFATSNRILFGRGKLSQAGEIAAQMGTMAFLVTGTGKAQPERVQALLEEKGIGWAAFPVSGEPTVELAHQAVTAAKEARADLVIGFGGGSVLDTAKAVSGMLTNPGELMDYLEVVGANQPLQHPAAPMLAIPTTAGTGTEVTRNAVLAVPEKKVKVSLRSSYILPKVSLIDPELTYTLPAGVTASTGMDALTQVLEPFVSVRANAMTDMFCREGLARAGKSLLQAYRQGDDVTAREDMAWASLLGGLSLANAGLGAAHGFAGPLGGMFDAPHGAVCARLLPIVVDVNVKALERRSPGHPALERYREAAGLLTGDPAASVAQGVRWIEELCAALDIPSFSTYGIRPADLPLLVEKAAVSSSMKGNPIVLEKSEMMEILEQAL